MNRYGSEVDLLSFSKAAISDRAFDAASTMKQDGSSSPHHVEAACGPDPQALKKGRGDK